MKRFYVEYNWNYWTGSKVIWVYLYAYSEKQIRDMFAEYDIVVIREVEELL